MTAYDKVYDILKMGEPEEITSKLTMPSDDNNPKTQMHSQLSHEPSEGVKSAIDQLMAALMDELKHRDKKDDDIIE